MGCVANLEQRREDGRRSVTGSGGKEIELLCQWRLRTGGILASGQFPYFEDVSRWATAFPAWLVAGSSPTRRVCLFYSGWIRNLES